MNVYQLENRITREKVVIEANSFQEACEKLGWQVSNTVMLRSRQDMESICAECGSENIKWQLEHREGKHSEMIGYCQECGSTCS